MKHFRSDSNLLAIAADPPFEFGLKMTPEKRDDEASEKPFQPLFNGKNLDGWKLTGSSWRLDGDALIGSPPPNNRENHSLVSGRKYRDFELTFKARLEKSQTGRG